MGKQWSKREAQIVAIVYSRVGMVGDLQGIAGKSMPEILGLDMRLQRVARGWDTIWTRRAIMIDFIGLFEP